MEGDEGICAMGDVGVEVCGKFEGTMCKAPDLGGSLMCLIPLCSYL